MKYLILIFALFFGAAFAQTSVSPGCAPQVAVGGGYPVDTCAFVPDQRRTNIQVFFNANEANPKVVITMMQTYGVTIAELEDAVDYRIDAVHYMRANGAPDGLGGLKVWGGSSIDRFLIWSGGNVDNAHARVLAQDVLDRAARRKALYESLGRPVPASIAPWELMQTGHIDPPRIDHPCFGDNCPAVGPSL